MCDVSLLLMFGRVSINLNFVGVWLHKNGMTRVFEFMVDKLGGNRWTFKLTGSFWGLYYIGWK